MNTALVPTQSSPLALPAEAHNPVEIYLNSLNTARSMETMRGALVSVLRTLAEAKLIPFDAKDITPADPLAFPWHNLRNAEMETLRGLLVRSFAPATAALYLTAVKGVLKKAWKQNLMSTDDYMRTVDVDAIRPNSVKMGRAVEAESLNTIFEQCESDPHFTSERDAAIVAVGYFGGLRRAEIAALDLSDWDAEARSLLVRRGKGQKTRTVYLAKEGADILAVWLEKRGKPDVKPLFLRFYKGGLMQTERISAQTVYNVLKRRSLSTAQEIIKPHDLRRSFATHLLEKGADVVVVGALMGHVKIETTKGYDRRGEKAAKEAASRLTLKKDEGEVAK